jgi:hypothetical protein
LELNNKGDYPFIQPLCRGLCLASRLRFGHSTDAPLNFFRPDAQSSEHLDPEGLVAPLVQTLEPTRYENDSGGCGVHIAGKRCPTPGIGRFAWRTHLHRIESRVQSLLLVREQSQLSVQHAKAVEWFLVRGFRAVRDALRCSDQSRR